MKLGRFYRNVAQLASATALAQLLLVVALPFITRLYTPVQIGDYALFMASIALLTPVISLRFELAIPLADSEAEATRLAAISLIIVIFNFLLIGFLSLFWGGGFWTFIGAENPSALIVLVPLGCFLTGLINPFLYLLNRSKDFRRLGRVRLVQAGVNVILQLGLSLYSFGMMLGAAISYSAGLSMAISGCRKKIKFSRVSRFNLLETFKRNIAYPKFSAPSAIVNSASSELPIFFISMIAGVQEVAFLIIVIRVVKLPMMMLGKSIYQVYHSYSLEYLEEGVLYSRTKSLLFRSACLFGPLIIAAVIGVSYLAEPVLGAGYGRVGELALWGAAWSFFVILASPVSAALLVLKKQKYILVFETIFIFLKIGSVFGASILNPDKVVEVYLCAAATQYIALLGMILFFVRRSSYVK